MFNAKNVICALMPLLLVCGVSACGSDFQTITVEGTNSSFAMPSGYKEGPLGKGYEYRGKKGEAAFVVVVYPRTNAAQDQAAGITDQEKIKDFAKKMMDGIKKKLPKLGYAGQMRFDGLIENQNGYTVQYTVLINERTIYNRFYITPKLIFYTDASAKDPQNKDIAKFYDMFKP